MDFISPSISTALNYLYIHFTHTLQFIVAHALGVSVCTSRLLATSLNIVTSSHCTSLLEVFICIHNSLITSSLTVLHCTAGTRCTTARVKSSARVLPTTRCSSLTNLTLTGCTALIFTGLTLNCLISEFSNSE
jgi:hypothetical protein